MMSGRASVQIDYMYGPAAFIPYKNSGSCNRVLWPVGEVNSMLHWWAGASTVIVESSEVHFRWVIIREFSHVHVCWKSSTARVHV